MNADVPDPQQGPATGPEPDFDDPSYADVRALLADAQVTDPIPADVAAELDETLADLVAQRAREEAPAGGVVVPLRRRIRPSSLLVAASTVVLLGAGAIGLNAVTSGSSDDSAASADSATTSREAPAAPEAAAGGSTTDTLGDSPAGVPSSLNNLALTYGSGTLASFDARRFPQQAATFVAGTRYLDDPAVTATDGEAPAPSTLGPDETSQDTTGSKDTTGGGTAGGDDQDQSEQAAAKAESERLLRSYAATPACPGPPVTDGSTVIRIRFAKQPATLVVHPEDGGTRLVEAWSCDGATRLATTTVPAS